MSQQATKPSLLLVAWASMAWMAFATIPSHAQQQDSAELVQSHLAAGEFAPAHQLAMQEADVARRDALLAQVANAQAAVGMRGSAVSTTASISNDQTRSSVFNDLAQQPWGGSGARGGAALADFDSLIELIESTIAPDSWETLGGPGAIESFPTGVFVDASGMLKRLEVDATLTALRTTSRDVKHAGDVARPSSLRKVSLTRLERELQKTWALGRTPDDVMRNLAGLHRVKFIFFYPETRDIVLAGPAEGWRRDLHGRSVSVTSAEPVLQLDDLVVVVRSVLTGDGRFGCAITPTTESLASVQRYLDDTGANPLRPSRRAAWLEGLREQLGRQQITVFGIDDRTHAARVLVEADYHMKLVGMGLEEGTLGVTSYLESVSVGPDGALPPMDVLRWWFSLRHSAIHTTDARDAFELIGPSVQVQSENEMLTARGERVHTGKSDALNAQFAHSFTKHFETLASKYPIYAELRNIFDLALVAAIVQTHGPSSQCDWQPTHYLDADKHRVASGARPRHVDTVMNHRVIGGKHVIVGVSGGVSVDPLPLQASVLKLDPYGALEGVAAQARPKSADTWWWD